ncbi:MAG: hypothetical protein PVF33_07135 [Candidatus Latescibacterota bacterium]
MKPALVLSTAIVLVFLIDSSAFGGAWVQKKRSYFLKFMAGYLYTTGEYDSEGNVRLIREGEPGIENTSYKEMSLTGYLEYGVTNRFTVVANLPFKVVSAKRTEAPTADAPMRTVEVITGGLSDLWLSGRLLLLGTSAPLSIQAGVKLPLGYDAAPPEGGAPLGSGKVDVEGALLAGAGIWPIRAYVTGAVGYGLRGGTDISNEYLFRIEGGFTPGNWLAKATLEGVYSTEKPTSDESSTVVITNQDVLKLMPTLAYRFHYRFAVGLEMIHTLAGRNTVTGTTYFVGVLLRN